MIRRAIVRKNTNTSEIHHVIGHNGSVFFSLVFKYLLILLLLFLIFLLLDNYIVWEYMVMLFAGLWLILFTKFTIDFFNIYLDALVMTDSWVMLYLREWLLEYQTEMFDWDRIETISHNQKWIWDKVFFKWDILIRLEHGIDFPFENVTSPKKQAAKILQLKDRFVSNNGWIENVNTDNQKFDILVEALWEVVKDYIDKWENKRNTFDDNEYGWDYDY